MTHDQPTDQNRRPAAADDDLRLGIVGCGRIADTHAKGLSDTTGLTVTAACDVHLDRAQATAEALGASKATADFRDLFDDVDAVLIALPHDLHSEVAIALMNAGKHVLVEKPMCVTEDQGIAMIDAAERNGVVLMTAYHNRYRPAMTEIKRLLDDKTYGEPFQMSFWTEQLTQYPEGHWALSGQRLGGGQFFSHGCHYVDLLLWLMGDPVEGFHLGTNNGTPWMEKEGTSNAAIRFANGGLGYHFGTWGARGTRLGWSLHIHCTDAMIEYTRGNGQLVVHQRIRRETSGETASVVSSSEAELLMQEPVSGKMTQPQFALFAECIRNGTQPPTSGPSSLQGLRVIWRLYQAEVEHKSADLRGLGLNEDWRAPAARTPFSGLDL